MTTQASMKLAEDLQASMDVEVAIKTATQAHPIDSAKAHYSGGHLSTEVEAPKKAVQVV